MLKHGKINKNPFVKHLKEFSKYDEEAISDIRKDSLKGYLTCDLDEEREVVINQDSIFLVNSKYSSLGYFEIPITDFIKGSGTFYFRRSAENSDMDISLSVFCNSKKDVYRFIYELDSFEKESDLKELLLVFQKIYRLKRTNLDLKNYQKEVNPAFQDYKKEFNEFN